MKGNYPPEYVDGYGEIEISYEKDHVICAGDKDVKYHSVYVSLDYIESFSRALHSDLEFKKITIIGDERYVSNIAFNSCVNFTSHLDIFTKVHVKKLKNAIQLASKHARKEIQHRVTLSIKPLTTIKGGDTVSSSSDRTFNSKQKNELWELNGGHCSACGVKMAPFKGHPNSFEADHIRPHAKGGSTNLGNGQALCRTCNRRKSNS